jgi:hypothetical protein
MMLQNNNLHRLIINNKHRLNHLQAHQPDIHNQLNNNHQWKLIDFKSTKNSRLNYLLLCVCMFCFFFFFFLFLSRDSIFVIHAIHKSLFMLDSIGYIQWWPFSFFSYFVLTYILSAYPVNIKMMWAHFFFQFILIWEQKI